jgi:hypothetical protein
MQAGIAADSRRLRSDPNDLEKPKADPKAGLCSHHSMVETLYLTSESLPHHRAKCKRRKREGRDLSAVGPGDGGPMTPAQFHYQMTQAFRLLPHGKRPTALHLVICRQLARWSNAWPSHGQLARAASCSVRTVQNALRRFRDLGLVSWEQRWIPGRQLSNRYRLSSLSLALPPTPRKQARKTQNQILLWSANYSTGRPQLPIRTVAQQLAMLGEGEGGKKTAGLGPPAGVSRLDRIASMPA